MNGHNFNSKKGVNMKHKVLINSINYKVTADFIQHTDAFFDTLSTSSCWQDILLHFKVFDPEVYVVFVEPEFERMVGQVNNLKSSAEYNGAVIVFVADSATCEQLEHHAKFIANLIIRRPISADNIVLKINRYLDDLNAAKERAKERELEREKLAEAERQALEAKAAEAVAKETTSEADPSAASVGKKHILIVDDDRTILKMLKSALGDTYEVTTMINGMMVEKLLDTKKVDLMILDYEMPIETGADIFRRVKKKPNAAQIPVCFLTGVTEREKIMEVMSLKPHGYLLKPIDMDMLQSTVKNLTD